MDHLLRNRLPRHAAKQTADRYATTLCSMPTAAEEMGLASATRRGVSEARGEGSVLA